MLLFAYNPEASALVGTPTILEPGRFTTMILAPLLPAL